jgi:hypothetical protein
MYPVSMCACHFKKQIRLLLCLFNDALSTTDHTASNENMIMNVKDAPRMMKNQIQDERFVDRNSLNNTTGHEGHGIKCTKFVRHKHP